MSNDKHVNDTELHAYLDHQLDAAQRREVAAALGADEHASAKLDDYQKINQELHRLYDPVLEERIPEHLLASASASASAPRRPRYRSLAASVLFFIFGSLLGWQAQLQLADNSSPKSGTDTYLVQPAAFAHAVYSADVSHPVEVSASQHDHLNKWLSKRLKTHLTAPDLTASGFHLIGGRLLPSTGDRMAAQYMYENTTGNRITLYVRRGDWQPDSQAIRHSEQNGLSMFYWTDDDIGYALTGNDKKDLQQDLAKEVYKQMSINSIKI